MTDTYKGESLQKKEARYLTHNFAIEWIWGRKILDFRKDLHIFLASREGGDIPVLSHLGVPKHNMVGLDRNEEAIRECSQKWADVPPNESLTLRGIEDGSPLLIHCMDAADEVAQIAALGERKIATVFWDFCGELGKDTIRTFTDTWTRLPVGSVLSIGVQKGREKRQRALVVPQTRPMNRVQRRAARAIGAHESYLLLERMMSGKSNWDIPLVLKTREKDSKFGPGDSRYLLMHDALSIADSNHKPASVLICEYQSITPDSNGVPMLICSFGKVRKSEDHLFRPERFRLTTQTMMRWRNAILTSGLSAHECALMFNVPERTAVAWKAHASRGTYGDAHVDAALKKAAEDCEQSHTKLRALRAEMDEVRRQVAEAVTARDEASRVVRELESRMDG